MSMGLDDFYCAWVLGRDAALWVNQPATSIPSLCTLPHIHNTLHQVKVTSITEFYGPGLVSYHFGTFPIVFFNVGAFHLRSVNRSWSLKMTYMVSSFVGTYYVVSGTETYATLRVTLSPAPP